MSTDNTEIKRIIQLEETAPKMSKKKRNRRRGTIVLIALLALGIFGFLWYGAAPKMQNIKNYESCLVKSGQFVSTTEASGTVLLPLQVEIVSPREGYAQSLLASEGDAVGKEDVLAILDVPDLEDELNDLNINLIQAKIELENIENNKKYALQSLERILKRLDADIAEAQEDAETLKNLASLKTSRQSDYELALDKVESLMEQKEDSQAQREETLGSTDISHRKQQAFINQLEAELEAVQEDIQECRIKSPIAGEILAINENLAIHGSLIKQSDSLFVVADRKELYIDFDVYEQYAGLLEPGTEMNVTIGTNTMKAKITKIGKIALMDSDGLSAMITVRAKPETDVDLTPGASAAASIVLEKKDNVLTLPRGAWLTTGNQKYVYVIRDSRAYKTEILIGEIQGNDVEILRGLAEGDEVITGSYQEYIDQDELLLK